MSESQFDLSTDLRSYLKDRIFHLPNGSKLILQTLKRSGAFNKEDLALESRVRRGELNHALLGIETLALVSFNTSGRQKLYSLTDLGLLAFEEFHEEIHTLKVE